MKEYIRTLKQNFMINWNEPVTYGIVSAMGGILGMVVVLIIMAVDGTGEDYGKIGAMLTLVFGGILFFLAGIFSVPSDFNIAISMGKTRKSYVPARYMMLMIDLLAVLLVHIVFSAIEGALYPALYPNAICELNVNILTINPILTVAFILVLPMIVLLLGVLLMIFSTKFFWVLWAIWMFACIGGPRLIHASTEQPESTLGKVGLAFGEIFSKVSAADVAVVLLVTAVIGMVITMILFRRQRVTL